MTKPDWGTKLKDCVHAEFQRDAERGEFAQANSNSVIDTIRGCRADTSTIDPDFGARMVCNISSVHVPLFVAASLAGKKAYKNGYDLGSYRIGGSAPSGSLKTREIVDRALARLASARPEDIYFGAVELNGAGVRFYGDICFVLKRNMVSGTTAVLDRNSYDLIRSPLREKIEIGNATTWDKSRESKAFSISGTWQDDLQDIAALKVLNELTSGNRRLTTGLISDGVLKDEDYIEVLRIGSFSAVHLQEARVSAADAAYEALIAQRRATGPRPRLEALVWRSRRRRADAALRRARVEVRVVTTTGRVKA
jgi:hypothetical protein